MEINKHNYQEILLLYIDGELTPDFEKEVQAFIDANNDVQQELDELLNAKLIQEDISFGDLSALYKYEKNCISSSNYKEYFTAFVDNELSKQQKQDTETYVLQHPQLQAEFIALQKTKLPLEYIEYPFKSSLYKKEKTIFFYLQRMAIAAVFIAISFFAWNLNSSNSSTTIATSVQTPKQVAIISNSQKIITVNEDSNKKIITSKNSETLTSAASNKSKLENKIENSVTKNNAASLQIQIDNNNTKPIEIISNNQIKNTRIESVVVANNKTNAQENTDVPTVKQIIYKTLDNDEDAGKTIVNIDSENKPSKLKGLLKKALNSITPKEDNDSRKLIAVTL